MIAHEKKPIASPSHISKHFAKLRHIGCDTRGQVIARDIV